MYLRSFLCSNTRRCALIECFFASSQEIMLEELDRLNEGLEVAIPGSAFNVAHHAVHVMSRLVKEAGPLVPIHHNLYSAVDDEGAIEDSYNGTNHEALFRDEDESAANFMDQSTRTLEEESFQAALAYARPTHILILDRGHEAIAVNLDATGYDEPNYAILYARSVRRSFWEGFVDRILSYMALGHRGRTHLFDIPLDAVCSCFRDYYYVLLFIV